MDDNSARELAKLLKHNQVLFKVDISANPISPDGARLILNSISEYNDTLGDLGDLEQSSMMGVRIREELRQAIRLNNSSHDKRKAFLQDQVDHTRANFVDSEAHDGPNAGAIVSTS